MSAEEADKTLLTQNSSSTGKPPGKPIPDEDTSMNKTKRSKTFTGCFTCRSRKVRCDLTKPYCNNCTRARLLCAGYDIKLRWSMPIKFNPKTGNAISSLVVFKTNQNTTKSNNLQEDQTNDSEFFQRRHVGFVKWDAKKNCKPYETYEEMDRDLAAVHSSGNDHIVSRNCQTKLVGPFGIFKYTPETRKRKPAESDTIPRKKTHEVRVQSMANSHENSPNDFQTNKIDESAAQDQLWLSNELRDDALLTAAALNGDSQFLEFMNNFASSNNLLSASTPNRFSTPPFSSSLPFPQPHQPHQHQPQQQQHSHHQSPQLNYQSHSHNGNNYPNDFLNLVFHRNTGLSANSQQPALTAMNKPVSSSNNISNLMGVDKSKSNVMIDPTNQHLYYSNYNNFYYDNPYQLNENLEIHLHASKVANNNQEDEGTDIVEGDNSNMTTMPDSIMSIVQSPLQPKLGFNVSLPKKDTDDNYVGLPTTALQVQPLTRYLLNYYVTQVADLMTVIPLTENPWKTIYFPRALMAIGELSALGTTSIAKNALLNALLAVSAFNLQLKFPKNSEPMKYYLNLGIRLRNQASLFVRKLLGSNNDTQLGVEQCIANEKYKDVLCAVMTMISVDLVWGTMQDTNFYIKWCGRVINTKMINKKKLSSKARILHRVFSSLKLIQDSTCLDLMSIKEDFEMNDDIINNEYDVNGDKFINKLKNSDANQSKSKIDFIVNSGNSTHKIDENIIKDTSPQFVNKKLINTKKNDENFATDALYGLPNSLIVLFKETVQLLRAKIYHQGTFGHMPIHFDENVKKLSDKLSKWKLDWKLYEEDEDENKEFFTPMHETTYHHILSFYHALTIYFNRLIKEISPNEVQDKVEKTLFHLNSIQKLIVQGEAAIIPLFWQGFIAGCEAISINLQMGFKKWGADIAQYLGSYWGARQIMLEVWRRKRMKESRADWVSVIQDWEMNLMLN